MEREELLEQVNAELGDTHLTLSERTINEELDDMLEDFGDDEDANKKLVAKIANRLKRMDGNLHSDVSTQVKEWKKKQKSKAKPEPKKKDTNDDDDDDAPEYIKKLNARLDAMEAAHKQEQTEKTKNATIKSVKESLTAKLKEAGFEVNSFFLNSAVRKLQIPDENADVEDLVAKLEKYYNADMKEAGVEPKNTKPHFGGNDGKGKNKDMDDYFARKAKKEGWSKDKK